MFDVSVTDREQYFSALESGVAHALGTALPSEDPGNTYLFAHSTPNPLEIKRYAAVFTLLNKLEVINYSPKNYDELASKQPAEVFTFDPTKKTKKDESFFPKQKGGSNVISLFPGRLDKVVSLDYFSDYRDVKMLIQSAI